MEQPAKSDNSTLVSSWLNDQKILQIINLKASLAAQTYESINQLQRAGGFDLLVKIKKQALIRQGIDVNTDINRLSGMRLKNFLVTGVRASSTGGSMSAKYKTLNRQTHNLWTIFKRVTNYRGGRLLSILVRADLLSERISLFFEKLDKLIGSLLIYAKKFR